MPRAQKTPISYEEFDSDIDIEEILTEDKDIDDIDTDELLGSSEDETPKKKRISKKATIKKTPSKKTPAKRKAPTSKKLTTTQTKLNLPKVMFSLILVFPLIKSYRKLLRHIHGILSE